MWRVSGSPRNPTMQPPILIQKIYISHEQISKLIAIVQSLNVKEDYMMPFYFWWIVDCKIFTVGTHSPLCTGFWSRVPACTAFCLIFYLPVVMWLGADSFCSGFAVVLRGGHLCYISIFLLFKTKYLFELEQKNTDLKEASLCPSLPPRTR